MKKFVWAIIVIVLAIILVSFIRLSPSGNVVDIDGNETDIISEETLAEHDNPNDCWVGYNGKVYDVTSWLPQHPGSAAAISPYCGTSGEFTEAFTAQHGTTQVATLMRMGVLIGDFEIRGNTN